MEDQEDKAYEQDDRARMEDAPATEQVDPDGFQERLDPTESEGLQQEFASEDDPELADEPMADDEAA
jgi:hypothetical protein